MRYLLLTGWLLFSAHIAGYAAETPGAAAPAGGEATAFSGKVLETTNTAGYTYIQVDTGKKKLWAAAPQFKVKPGDQVAVAEAMPMANYHSKTLNRDFDVVYFAGSVQVNGAAPAGSSTKMELPKGHPPIHGAATNPATNLDFSKLQKAPGGQTVQEVIQGKAKLAGKEVKVRGKVVKFNANIMGKNWLHLRDGTGSEGSNDLLVTTPDTAKVGDTVLVTGKVATDKDFGMNYKYAVMVEDAKVAVE
jgi:hypothetical protein